MVTLISYLLVFLFIYAAVSKLLDYQKFQVQLLKSPLLTPYAHSIAWSIPLIELLVCVLLLLPQLQLLGLYAAYSLMLAFTGYIVIILNYSPYVPCSCGGILSSMGWTTHLVFNLVVTLLSFIAILLYYKHPFSSLNFKL
ncbi:MauE/DoxX family redox-associated membrane protein [Zhouia sp. PK063]|uniref:MauE/DoxX family redox-associated membrane protein n=1 Tax=Zhouia sp. PK063 TaxID=3373602 RepID=UPI0037AC197F